ncbi:MAG: peroxidase [Phycisphaerae bacterium]|nr:peroxidase [Phycisphaerae bacterium]
MTRLKPIEAHATEGVAAETLNAAPFNIFKAMANNPTVMEGLMALSGAISKSESLSPAETEAVMLRVSERNGCEYCLAAHTKIASNHGVDSDAAISYRRGEGTTNRESALLSFVDAILERNGWVEDSEMESFRAAGFGDDAVVEVVAVISWMTFTNTFNHVNRTELDFPAVPEAAGT